MNNTLFAADFDKNIAVGIVDISQRLTLSLSFSFRYFDKNSLFESITYIGIFGVRVLWCQVMNSDVAEIILKQNYDILRKLEDLEQTVKDLQEINCILAELVRKKIDEPNSTEDKEVIQDTKYNDIKQYDGNNLPDPETRSTGTVRWFDKLKGFGFIHVTGVNTITYTMSVRGRSSGV
ncbi:unnamed protein product [Acanthoscelides obtectus]|uniref:Uncharacterized protein n=1 Tax=Acanthoscelides obtectus TaxID=200917 RepID=A0A9P0L3V6_ACAOB|nr:unnamed protein product [Acanthoscelides obtectus]CAK1653124.1 hypothetical protein AOBTE_LOCUS18076 [Acanthoscelides obtectus]